MRTGNGERCPCDFALAIDDVDGRFSACVLRRDDGLFAAGGRQGDALSMSIRSWSGSTSTALASILSSPSQPAGSSAGASAVRQCEAIRGSLLRSRARVVPGIMPKEISPSSTKSTSVPLIRGGQSLSSVAIVACLRTPNAARTICANSERDTRRRRVRPGI